MKIKLIKLYILFCATSAALGLQAQTLVEPFEYPTNEDLASAWFPSASTQIAVSDSLAPNATGTKSISVTFTFPSVEYSTQFITGPDLPQPVSIFPEQYVSFRVKGDPAFANADFRNLYLYAYDAFGNFGRWGGPVPKTDSWHVMNYLASDVEKPWNSPGLPDLSQIVRFAFFQWGSAAAIPEYTATIHLDEVAVRPTPLVETAPLAGVIEDFEYPSSEALASAWIGSQNALVQSTGLVDAHSSGTNAMQVTFNFPSGEWATETVTGPVRETPLVISPSQYLSFRVKGDPAFSTSDFKTLYLYAFDDAGNLGRWGSPVPTTDRWQVVNYLASTMEKPWNSSALPDLSRIMGFAFVQYGSAGAIPAYSATVAIDDLTLRDTPLTNPREYTEYMAEPFEHASSEDLTASWTPSSNTSISLAEDVSSSANGAKSMRIDFSFPSSEWATESVRGPQLETPLAIGKDQYVVFRVKGDPAFAASDFKNLYLYVYDSAGNFGRWGSSVPLTAEWKVFNYAAAAIEKPWNSQALPNLDDIVRFAFVQYGSQAALEPYNATIYVDEIMVRNSPLTDFPPAAPARSLIDDFESYSSTANLLQFYSYVNGTAETFTTASLQSPAPEGNNALQLAISFGAGQYPWGSVRSAKVAPFSFPTNGILSVRFKGDESLAPVADAGTTFWITFYDAQDRSMNLVLPATVVTNSDWHVIEADLQAFGNTSLVDIGNLVQWRILVQGWEGTAENWAWSATFYVDDLRINVPAEQPTLSISHEANGIVVSWAEDITGYTLESASTLSNPVWEPVANVQNNQATISPTAGARFYRLRK